MNIDKVFRIAAESVAGEPVSIESDGTIWADSDGRVIDLKAVAAEVKRLDKAAADQAAAKEAAKASALAKLEALGLTADEAQAIAGF